MHKTLLLKENVIGIINFTTKYLQIDMTMNIIDELQRPYNKYLNGLFVIGDTSICKLNSCKICSIPRHYSTSQK